MTKDYPAKVSKTINSSLSKVWDALINPDSIKKYMFGTTVISDWVKESRIRWKGTWEGKEYEDKGIILEIIPEKRLTYSHFSPLGRLNDIPENYHIVTIDISAQKNDTLVQLSQTNNKSDNERSHSEKNWSLMLESLKEFLEN